MLGVAHHTLMAMISRTEPHMRWKFKAPSHTCIGTTIRTQSDLIPGHVKGRREGEWEGWGEGAVCLVCFTRCERQSNRALGSIGRCGQQEMLSDEGSEASFGLAGHLGAAVVLTKICDAVSGRYVTTNTGARASRTPS